MCIRDSLQRLLRLELQQVSDDYPGHHLMGHQRNFNVLASEHSANKTAAALEHIVDVLTTGRSEVVRVYQPRVPGLRVVRLNVVDSEPGPVPDITFQQRILKINGCSHV